MFGNRAFAWKLAGAVALMAGMGAVSSVRGKSINPPLWRLAAEPARWHDTLVWVGAARVVSVGNGEFTVEADGVRMPVRGECPAGQDARIELRATFRSEGPHLVLVRARAFHSTSRYRWVVEAVSVVVLAGVLLNLSRHFAFRPKVLQVEGA